jgi:hypothetical protein
VHPRAVRQRLRLYTGDSLRYFARSHAHRQALGIPAAEHDQALIDHAFITTFNGGFAYAAHPIAIRATRTVEGGTEVHIDDRAVIAGRHYDVAEHTLYLLPFDAGDDGLGGVRGLRVSHVDKRGLHLRLLHAPAARLTVVGPPASRWRSLLAERQRELIGLGCTPLWLLPDYGTAERANWAQHGEYERSEAEMSWLTSAVLRRIGLWHTTSTAFCSRYWMRGDQTMIWELRHLYGVRPAHDEFAALLGDPVWGPSLQILDSHCDCHHRRPDAGGRPHPNYERNCMFEFHRPERPGVLQIRFRTGPPREEDEPRVRAELTGANADPAWLNRVLPRSKVMP